jgi:hypothetical protein
MILNRDLIESAETIMARHIALGAIVKRPVSYWRQIIPGIFFFDFLKRTGEVRKHTQYYLSTRLLALEAAQRFPDGHPEEQLEELITVGATVHLGKYNIYSDEILKIQEQVIFCLYGHYRRLLATSGQTYDELIQNGYPDLSEMVNFVDQLISLEQELISAFIDQGIMNGKMTVLLETRLQSTEEQFRKLIKSIESN